MIVHQLAIINEIVNCLYIENTKPVPAEDLNAYIFVLRYVSLGSYSMWYSIGMLNILSLKSGKGLCLDSETVHGTLILNQFSQK